MCTRVEHSAVTKRTYESLVLSGALDKIDSNRNYMKNILGELVTFVQKKRKVRYAVWMPFFYPTKLGNEKKDQEEDG